MIETIENHDTMTERLLHQILLTQRLTDKTLGRILFWITFWSALYIGGIILFFVFFILIPFLFFMLILVGLLPFAF